MTFCEPLSVRFTPPEFRLESMVTGVASWKESSRSPLMYSEALPEISKVVKLPPSTERLPLISSAPKELAPPPRETRCRESVSCTKFRLAAI